jgi:acyl-CoA thioesterase II
VRVVDDVDVSDPDLTGPPDLDVWTRFPGAPTDELTSQALLAFASDGFLIGTAMRPHEGVGQAQAHVTVTTGVVSHTLTFHEPFAADDWLLLSHHSPYAGRGRSYGRGDVFTAAGSLVASFVQDGMIRPKDPTRSGAL